MYIFFPSKTKEQKTDRQTHTFIGIFHLLSLTQTNLLSHRHLYIAHICIIVSALFVFVIFFFFSRYHVSFVLLFGSASNLNSSHSQIENLSLPSLCALDVFVQKRRSMSRTHLPISYTLQVSFCARDVSLSLSLSSSSSCFVF